MQITLTQAEIEEAVSLYIGDRVAIKEGHTIAVSFKATRGDDGATATVDILAEDQVPFKTDDKSAEEAAPVVRQKRQPREAKHVMVPEKEEAKPEPQAEPEAHGETAQESKEALKEEATEEAKAAEPEVASEEAEVAQEAQQEVVVEAPKKPSLFGNLKR